MKKMIKKDQDYAYGFSKKDAPIFKTKKGISSSIIRQISKLKNEPQWMTDFRLKSYSIFKKMHVPKWGADLSDIRFDQMTYFARATDESKTSWEDLPEDIKDTYDKIGVPEIERDFLAGVSAQYDSEVVYESVKKELDKQGVIFCDMDSAVKKYPRMVKKYLGTLIPQDDNIFAALNSAAWSGGSFIFVPKNVHVKLPLQAYFRINAERFGQFERTLIIADKGSRVHYVEGCTAPLYTTLSMHAAVVEIFVREGAHVQYSTVQNWSDNMYNLVTKRAITNKDGVMRWVDCNIGSRVTMKYPAVILNGEGARGEMLSMTYAKNGQHLDTGAKMIHRAPKTTSHVISTSISKQGGRSSFRNFISIEKDASNCSAYSSCNALITDDRSRSDTYPRFNICHGDSRIQHEATTEKIDGEKIFYLMARGISQKDAEGIYVNGFIEPVVKQIPLEYSVELSRLMNMEMSGGNG